MKNSFLVVVMLLSAGCVETEEDATTTEIEEARASLSEWRATSEAKVPSAMLMDLDDAREERSEHPSDPDKPSAIPDEAPQPARPGAKKPAMMLQDLDEPSAAMRSASDRPMPIPDEAKP